MATEKKYLDLVGLGTYNAKIKEWVSANFNKYDDTELAGRVTDLETLTNNYATVVSNAAAGKNAADAWTVFLGGTDISKPSPKLSELATTDALTSGLANKVDKVEGMGLSQNSYTNDEKTKLGGIASGAQVNVIESVKVNNTALTVTGKAVNIDLSSYDTIARVNTELAKKADATSVYTKTEIDTKVGDINTEVAKKANSATTLSGYGITDAYTKTEVDDAVELAKNQILGIVDDATLTGAYDTLKEVAEWIENDTSGAAAMQTDIANLKSSKADKATTLSGYGITDAYTKTQVDTAIAGVKVTATGDEGTYVNVSASVDTATGRAITLTVDDTALSNKIATIESGKTSMSVGADGVVFSQGSGDSEIKLSPITTADINALFPTV